MNEAREKARFKASLAKLINGFVESMKPTAAVPYLGAGDVDPLEHTTRAYFIDNFLMALGWDLRTIGGALIEEARIKEETTLFLDYLGVNPETRAPLAIIEAKAWSKPMVAPSEVTMAKESSNTAYATPSLIASAVEHCKKGGSIETSPVTIEWARWISKLHDYVRGTLNRSAHVAPRAVVTSGQWLVIFVDPENAFINADDVDAASIIVFSLMDFVEHSDAIFDLLAYDRLIRDPPPYIAPTRLHAYVAAPAIKSLFRALWIRRQEGGAHFKVHPQLYLYAAAVIERTDGVLVTVLDDQSENTVPHDLDELSGHIDNVQAASDQLLEAMRQELGQIPEPLGIERFSGFVFPPTISVIGGLVPPGGRPGKLLLKSWPARADEFLLVTGACAHFFRLVPTVTPCAGHDWVRCQSLGQNKGIGPIVSRSVQPVSFFISGEDHHCAHRIVHDRREERCHILPFEEFLCCRACELQTVCWSEQEISDLPCGVAVQPNAGRSELVEQDAMARQNT